MATKEKGKPDQTAKPTRAKRAKAGSKADTATTDLLAVLVIDMSGSMGGVRDAVVESFNSYLKDLKDDEEGETFCTLVVFDDNYEPWSVAEPIANVAFLDGRYTPRGMTALNDAIAKSISDTEAKLREMGRSDMKVLHVTVTDGGENASQEYRGANQGGDGEARLAKLVSSYEAKGNWTFVLLGANQDAHETGMLRGYSPGATANYTSDSATYSTVGASLSAMAMNRRGSGQMASATPFADAGVSQEISGGSDYGNVGGDPGNVSGIVHPTTSSLKKPDAPSSGLTSKSLSDLFGGK